MSAPRRYVRGLPDRLISVRDTIILAPRMKPSSARCIALVHSRCKWGLASLPNQSFLPGEVGYHSRCGLHPFGVTGQLENDSI